MSERALVLLFQGDSITDADRDRDNRRPNDLWAMGRGYAGLAMCRWLAEQARRPWLVYNRGVSGDKVSDLLRRWDDDAIALAPDVVSILIGINDLWHKLGGDATGTPSDYEREYEALLARTRRALPEVRLVVGEPFVLRTGVVDERWFPELDERRAIAERLARRFDAVFIPYQSLLDTAVAKGTEPAHWAEDGVHPTPAGHHLMADAWCRRVSDALAGWLG